MDLNNILFGVVLLLIGPVGLYKSIRILFLKKQEVLPGYDLLFALKKKRSEEAYLKSLLSYRKNDMKKTAWLYLIMIPVATFFYLRMIIML